MNDDALMERVHFINRSDSTPKALVISAQGIEQIPFSFRKKHHVTTDCEKAFHDIRLNQTEEIYIELHFQDRSSDSHYLSVLEDNPFLPETKEKADEIEREAVAFLDDSIRKFQIEKLNAEIDQALDVGDKKNLYEANRSIKSAFNELMKKQSPTDSVFCYTKEGKGVNVCDLRQRI